MKRMLKKVFSVLALLSTSVVFAAEPAYDALYKKAKDYEAQKKWISAAGTYYDAIVASPNENGVDAYNAFFKIINNIKTGNPGNDELDDFEKVTAWEELAKDAEEYFTLNTPYDVFFLYNKGKLNMEKKTCAYTFVPYAAVSEKFDTIYTAMKTGKKKVSGCTVPAEWPAVSIYKNASKTGNALVATVTLPPSNDVGVAHYDTLTKEYEYVANIDRKAYNKSYLVPAFAMADFRIAKNKFSPSFYNLTFDILDESGKVVASSAKAGLELKKLCNLNPAMSNGLADEPSKIVLNVSSPAIKAIDGGKFTVRVSSMTLRDSSLAGRMVKEDSYESQVHYTEKVYKEVKVSIPYVRGTIKINNPDFGYIQYSMANNRPILETLEKASEESRLLSAEVEKVLNLNFELYSDENVSFFYAVKEISLKNVPSKIYDSIEPILNAASETKGYKPAYSCSGKTNYREWKQNSSDPYRSYWVEQPAVDLTADGFRNLTNEETRLLHQATLAKKIPTYGTIGRTINPKNKDKVIAAFEAEKKAKQLRILAALDKEVEVYYSKFLKEPANYKEDFKKIDGTLTASPIEVTQGLYEKIMGNNPSKDRINALYPVNNVSFYEAAVFCNKLSMAAGLTPAYTLNKSTDPAAWGAIPAKADAKWDKMTVNEKANGFRLPNEKEAAIYGASGNGNFTGAYYVGLKPGSETKKIEGELIKLPVVSPDTSYGLWNANDNVYEMFKSKKAAGYYMGIKIGQMESNAAKDSKVGFRVVCGK